VQFPPVHLNGPTFLPGQANNFYVFLAIGMAVFMRARAAADQVPSQLLKQGLLFPSQSNIPETKTQTAARIAKLVFDSGLGRVYCPPNMVAFIGRHVYRPEHDTRNPGRPIYAAERHVSVSTRFGKGSGRRTDQFQSFHWIHVPAAENRGASGPEGTSEVA
jgi:malate dehydrogenase (oxaloacetate-decarboxylating)(NADP+)